MSLIFGPRNLVVSLTPQDTVTVAKWDGTPVTLAAPVVVDSQGRVSFTVADGGKYLITARRHQAGDSYQTFVTLTEDLGYGPDLESKVDYLIAKDEQGGGGPGGPVDWDDVQDKPAIIAAGATQAEARSAVGAGTSNFSGSYTDLTSKPTIPTTAADVGAVPTSRTVAGKALSANVTLVKADVGLASVDNTSDAAKPVSSAAQTALDGKAASVHTHTASQISDSTTTGRAILTAADAAAARAAVGAAGLNTLGLLQGVFISNGGTIPPEAVSPYIVVIEQA